MLFSHYTRTCAESTDDVLVGKAEDGGQVAAHVRDGQQCERNAEHGVDDRGNSTDGRLGRDVSVACAHAARV